MRRASMTSRTLLLFIMLVYSALELSPGHARKPAVPPLAPRVVRQHFADADHDCRIQRGRPIRRGHRDATYRFDFDGDGRRDWVIDEGKFLCDGAWSIYRGSQGDAQVLVYVVRRNGSAFLAFRHGALGLFHGANGKRIYIGVGGPLCGQRVTPATSRADMIRCRRPLVWNAAKSRVEFGPLSRILAED